MPGLSTFWFCADGTHLPEGERKYSHFSIWNCLCLINACLYPCCAVSSLIISLPTQPLPFHLSAFIASVILSMLKTSNRACHFNMPP